MPLQQGCTLQELARVDEEEDDIVPWDDERASISPIDDMSPFDQLILYQQFVRKIAPLLDAYETAVLLQIIDRITGWKKVEARFSAEKLYQGDSVYGGLQRTMHYTKMFRALRSLEKRQVIRRRRQQYGSEVRIYRVNFNVGLTALEGSAPKLRKGRTAHKSRRSFRDLDDQNDPIARSQHRDGVVANSNHPVSFPDCTVANGDAEVVHGDPRERYLDNNIRELNLENTPQPVPAVPAAGQSRGHSGQEGAEEAEGLAQARPLPEKPINPRPRSRRPPTI
jgi:hypothetical protein